MKYLFPFFGFLFVQLILGAVFHYPSDVLLTICRCIIGVGILFLAFAEDSRIFGGKLQFTTNNTVLNCILLTFAIIGKVALVLMLGACALVVILAIIVGVIF